MKSFIRLTLLALIPLILLYPGGYLTYISSVTIYQELALRHELHPAQKWPTLPIKIIETRFTKPPVGFTTAIPEFHCVFSYTIAGRPHTVDYTKFSGHYSLMARNRHGLAQQYADRPFDKRPPPRAFIDPADPSHAIPVAAFNDPALGVELATAGVALVLGLLILALALLPSFAIIRSTIKDRSSTAKGANKDDAHLLKPNGGPTWMWLLFALPLTPGILPIAVFTLPKLLAGTDEPSYWVAVVLQFILPIPFWLLFLRGRRWWKRAGQSLIELSPHPVTLLTPPRGRLTLAPMSDCPDKLEVRYELSRRYSSKSVGTLYKTIREVHQSSQTTGHSRPWYLLHEDFTTVPQLQKVPITRHTTYWIIRIRGRTNGRKFTIQFLHPISAGA